MKKKILGFLVFLFLLLLAVYHDEIGYGLTQGYGQLKIISNVQPVDSILNDPNFPDSLKRKLLLIQEVRQFAVDSLGINDSENYTTLYDQKGKPILWVVNASPKYSINAYEWCFPIAGCFPYKGFFDYQKALEEERMMKEKGFDTQVREVGGWSTLGFFKDPILSQMLDRSTGDLCELIIHELTHATLYIKDSADYNENLASFVGDYGALEFLRNKFGHQSKEYMDYWIKLKDSKRFEKELIDQIEKLHQFYLTLDKSLDEVIKDSLKNEAIKGAFSSIDISKFDNSERYKWIDSLEFVPNNAYFSQYLTYHKEANSFEEEFRTDYKLNFRKYLHELKLRYAK